VQNSEQGCAKGVTSAVSSLLEKLKAINFVEVLSPSYFFLHHILPHTCWESRWFTRTIHFLVAYACVPAPVPAVMISGFHCEVVGCGRWVPEAGQRGSATLFVKLKVQAKNKECGSVSCGAETLVLAADPLHFLPGM